MKAEQVIRGAAVGAVIATCAAGIGSARAETGASDPKAVSIAKQVMAALGGAERWNALPGLRWTFGVEIRDTVRNARHHAWNRFTGWHRVEGKDRNGTFCIIHNLNDGKGMAWVNGVSIEGDSLAKLIERGKALWVNDGYWLLMPYKMLDPGVTVKIADPVTRDGTTYDRIALSFTNVGLTPGDQYWVDVAHDTHRVERWEMVLQGEKPPARVYSWEGWEEHGGLWFATAHRQGTLNVFTRDIETVKSFGPDEFRKP